MSKVCRSCCGPCTCTLNTVPGYSGCNHPPTTLALTGIGCSSGTITVTATSSNTAVVPTPTVTYTSPNSTGTVNITFSGEDQVAIISVTVGNGSCSITKTATVTVGISARPPFLDPTSLPSSITLVAGAAPSSFSFSGVSPSPDVNLAGTTGHCANGVGSLAITGPSDNPGAVPNASVTYTSPNTTGSFSVAANLGSSGQTGHIFLTVTQNNMQVAFTCCLDDTVYSIPFTVT